MHQPPPRILLAAERAVHAGARILRQGRGNVGTLIEKGDRDFATAVDIGIEQAVRSVLTEDCPEIPILGEELGGADLDSPVLWVLDPIDGTVNFLRQSLICAISLALVEDGQPTLAIVEAPFLGEHYTAASGSGAYLNGRPIRVSATRGLDNAVISLTDVAVDPESHLPDPVQLAVMQTLAKDAFRTRIHGSEAVDLAWVAAGRLDAALMFSNLPWDVSGGVLLVREAGGIVSDERGEPHTTGSQYTLASTPGINAELVEIVWRAANRRSDAGGPAA